MKSKKLRSLIALLMALVLLGVLTAGFYAEADDAADEKLCDDYWAWLMETEPEYYRSCTREDVYIARDFGSYDGGRIVLMLLKDLAGTDDMLHLEFGGHVFVFGSGSYEKYFLFYKDGSFCKVQTAFERGELTQASVDMLWKTYFERIYHLEFGFPDVAEGAWYAEYVKLCAGSGWMQGYPDGSFQPKAKLTRAMFVTVLYRLDQGKSSSEALDNPENPFRDVKDGTWYTDAAIWAGTKGIVKGTSPGVFSPNAALSREQAVTMIKRYADLQGTQLTPGRHPDRFPDENDCAEWALTALRWMKQAGIIDGDENGNFQPKNSLTRAECAKILVRLNDYLEQPQEAQGGILELTRDTEHSSIGSWRPSADGSDRLALLSFCADLARQTLNDQENLVLSPVSALYALGMCASGAKQNTLAQLEAAFGLNIQTLNFYLHAYGRQLTAGTNGQVNLANSIWMNNANRFTVPQDYLQALVSHYDAQAFYGAFDQAMCEAINAWISRNTDGMIPSMLDEIDRLAAIYLINTLSLKLEWSEPYMTPVQRPFYPASGEAQQCDMLYGEETCYLKDENTTGFMKPFENGFAFVALLPDENVPISAYLASLTGEKLAGLLDHPNRECTVFTQLPEFETDSSFELIDPLEALGIRDLFIQGAANLSGMGSDQLYVTRVLQKAHLKLDRNGTEAAAATVLIEEDAAIPFDDIYYVQLNRPFIYMIVDQNAKLPLFIGVINGFAD